MTPESSGFLENCQALDNYLSDKSSFSKGEATRLLNKLKSSILENLSEEAIKLLSSLPPFTLFEETEEFKCIAKHEELILRKYQEINSIKDELAGKMPLNSDIRRLSEWLNMGLHLCQDDSNDYFSINVFEHDDEDIYDDTFPEDLQLYGDTWEYWAGLHMPKLNKPKVLDLRRYFQELQLLRAHLVQPNKREREGLSLILEKEELMSRDEVKSLLDTYCSFREMTSLVRKREELEALKSKWKIIVEAAMSRYKERRENYRSNFGWLEHLGVPDESRDLYINSIKIYKERIVIISQYEERIKKAHKQHLRMIPGSGIRTFKLNWKLLEEYDKQGILLGIEKYYSRLNVDEIDLERLERLLDIIDCEQIYEGSNSFSGYICFYLRGKEFVILEKPIYGNATYLIPKEKWIKFSQMTRSELRKFPQVKKCWHCSTWTECIKSGL